MVFREDVNLVDRDALPSDPYGLASREPSTSSRFCFTENKKKRVERTYANCLANKELIICVGFCLLLIMYTTAIVLYAWKVEPGQMQGDLLTRPATKYVSALTETPNSEFSRKLLELKLLVLNSGKCMSSKDVGGTIDVIVIPTTPIGLEEAGNTMDLFNPQVTEADGSTISAVMHYNPLCGPNNKKEEATAYGARKSQNTLAYFYSGVVVQHEYQGRVHRIVISDEELSFCIQQKKWELMGVLPDSARCVEAN